MLDYRLKTFLKLCETMNYRITAQSLNMTQPAVTQHIQFLEREYGCRLFEYAGKKLSMTKEASVLLEYARSAVYNEKRICERLKKQNEKEIRIGATKTIGEFILKDSIIKLVETYNGNITLLVDNTQRLLKCIDSNELDFALVEGFFDKSRYGYELFKEEEVVGICSKTHRFAGESVRIEDMLSETIIVREEGSGTREIFEQVLHEHNFLIDNFKRCLAISSFSYIKDIVSKGLGISFVYKGVVQKKDNLSTFTISDNSVVRELNYVYLKDTDVKDRIARIKNYIYDGN